MGPPLGSQTSRFPEVGLQDQGKLKAVLSPHSGSELELSRNPLCFTSHIDLITKSTWIPCSLPCPLPAPPMLVLVFPHPDVHRGFPLCSTQLPSESLQALLSPLYTPAPNFQPSFIIFKYKFLCFTLNTLPILTCCYTLPSPSIYLLAQPSPLPSWFTCHLPISCLPAFISLLYLPHLPI